MIGHSIRLKYDQSFSALAADSDERSRGSIWAYLGLFEPILTHFEPVRTPRTVAKRNRDSAASERASACKIKLITRSPLELSPLRWSRRSRQDSSTTVQFASTAETTQSSFLCNFSKEERRRANFASFAFCPLKQKAKLAPDWLNYSCARPLKQICGAHLDKNLSVCLSILGLTSHIGPVEAIGGDDRIESAKRKASRARSLA